MHGSFKGEFYTVDFWLGSPAGSGVIGFDGGIIGPGTLIPTVHFPFTSPEVMSGQKRLVGITETFECFQFATDVDMSLVVTTDIKRDYPDRVTGNQIIICFLIVKGKGEDTVQFFEEMNAFILI